MQGTYEEISQEVPEENKLELLFKEDVENVECEEIIEEEAKEYILIAQAMIEFVAKNGGVGLSAPQVGIKKQLIVWQGKDNTFHIGFNPKFFSKGKKINTIESCLSYPEEEYFVSGRRKYIQAVYYALNQGGKLVKITRSMRDDEAIIYQHEVHHIEGKTIAMIGRPLRVRVDEPKEKIDVEKSFTHERKRPNTSAPTSRNAGVQKRQQRESERK